MLGSDEAQKITQTLIPDTWLSAQLGKPAFSLISPADLVAEADFPDVPCFISCRLEIGENRTLKRLTLLGFDLVCTQATYNLNTALISQRPKHIRFACTTDCDAIAKIAYESFSFDRFHQDPQISDNVASTIKLNWAKSFFSGNRGDWLIVAHRNKQITGFAQLLLKDGKNLVIDLIAVDREYQNQGIATELIEFASNECLSTVQSMIVGTQVANEGSCRLYQRLGFVEISRYHMLHLHLPRLNK